jgi:hypothetical protein
VDGLEHRGELPLRVEVRARDEDRVAFAAADLRYGEAAMDLDNR